MVQKSGDHQLRLVVFSHDLPGFYTFQVLQDFFHQQYDGFFSWDDWDVELFCWSYDRSILQLSWREIISSYCTVWARLCGDCDGKSSSWLTLSSSSTTGKLSHYLPSKFSYVSSTGDLHSKNQHLYIHLLPTVKWRRLCNRGKDHEETFSKVVEKAGRWRESVPLLLGYVCQTPVPEPIHGRPKSDENMNREKGKSPLIIAGFFYSFRDLIRCHVDSFCTYPKMHSRRWIYC